MALLRAAEPDWASTALTLRHEASTKEIALDSIHLEECPPNSLGESGCCSRINGGANRSESRHRENGSGELPGIGGDVSLGRRGESPARSAIRHRPIVGQRRVISDPIITWQRVMLGNRQSRHVVGRDVARRGGLTDVSDRRRGVDVDRHQRQVPEHRQQQGNDEPAVLASPPPRMFHRHSPQCRPLRYQPHAATPRLFRQGGNRRPRLARRRMGARRYPPVAAGRRSSRRSSCAFSATTIVDTLISTAPTAGASVKPIGASTPAASGIAIRL